MPVYTNNGVVIKRRDTTTAMDEAANMIVHQLTEVMASEVRIVVDNTDIFVRLLRFCCQGIIPTSTCIDGFANICGRAVIDINAVTLYKHRGIIPDLLAAHGITDCDTVTTSYGQTKCTSLMHSRTCGVDQSVTTGAPSLASLLLTYYEFNENVAYAHLQASVWRNVLQSDPTNGSNNTLMIPGRWIQNSIPNNSSSDTPRTR